MLPVYERVCEVCGEAKPVTEFSKKEKKACKECYRKALRASATERNDLYEILELPHRGKKSLKYLSDSLRQYDLSSTEYLDMLDEQENCCAICGVHPKDTKSKRRLVIDHCHTTGKVRGLLCGNCNTMIGHAKDNVFVLIDAIKYLAKSKEVTLEDLLNQVRLR